MATLLNTLRSGRVLLMDGAMGTELQKLGLAEGENGAAWNALYPERVRAVHEAYRAAGAEVFLTNTFLANHVISLIETFARALQSPTFLDESTRALLELIGPESWGKVFRSDVIAWKNAFDVIGEKAGFRLANLGPVSSTDAVLEFGDLQQVYKSSRFYRLADAILLETCSTPRGRYVIRRLRRDCMPPILLSLTYVRNDAGRLVSCSGHGPEWFARRAAAWGVAALGVNCGRDIDMDDVIEIIRRYRSVTEVPLFARPNAGTPKKVRKRWVYPLMPKEMAARLPELLEAGAAMVGGCCGTTPEHIAAMRPVVEQWNRRHRPPGGASAKRRT
jgi:methionine synthase I (cobalamin-dependent)